jgi:hypothetical protein
LTLLCVIAAGCGGAAQPQASSTHRTAQPAASVWSLRVAVGTPAVGPITVTALPLRPAAANDAHPWMQHELVFRNDGNRPVTFADTRTSRFLGEVPRLIAGDEGCGYEQRPARVIAGACEMYLDAFTVPPHAAVTRTVTLFKELPGMKRLVPGTYVFPRPIRFAVGGTAPDAGDGHAAMVKVRYVVSRS